MPNIPANGIYDNWAGSGPTYTYNDQFDIKIDQQFSQKNLLSAKYSQNWNHNNPYNCFKDFADPVLRQLYLVQVDRRLLRRRRQHHLAGKLPQPAGSE